MIDELLLCIAVNNKERTTGVRSINNDTESEVQDK